MYEDIAWKKAISKGLKREEKEFTKICPRCKKSFSVLKKMNGEGVFYTPKKEKKFCSIKCANSREMNKEIREKIGETLRKEKELKTCLSCGKIFSGRGTKFCSLQCVGKAKRINSKSLKEYRRRCSFMFNPYDYIEEFNFSLIEEFGWYKPKNKENNLNGISRDHMVSVKYGFENNIPSQIIAHPANCKLVLQNKNSSKCDSCSIGILELAKKIIKWDNKHGVYL